jgi:hypothetical protein
MARSIVTSVLLVAALAFTSRASADIRAAATGTTATEAPTAPAPQKKPPKAAVPTSIAVMVAYQRVGHDLLALLDQRGKFDCGDLEPRFRAIKLADAVTTPASRTAAAATLAELAAQIERWRGIHVDQACLDNPLAPGCQ